MRTFVLLLVAWASTSVEAIACQCGRKPSVEESLARSRPVVEGTLVSKQVVLGTWDDWIYPAVEYEFAVTRVWVGPASETLVLRGHYSNCASYFDGGQTYLIFASPNDDSPGSLTSTICSRTAPVAKAAADLAALGAPRATFTRQLQPWMHIPAHRVFRAYFLAGIAGYVNFARHLGNGYASLGFLPITATLLALGALVVATVLVRRNTRLAAVLAAVGLVVAVAAILLAGAVVLRNPYFAPFISW